MSDAKNMIPVDHFPFVVAVDGPAASGKGTLAKRLARYFDLRYLDTGSLYRAVAAKMIKKSMQIDDIGLGVGIAKSITPDDLRTPLLRTMEVSQGASKIAAIPEIRQALLEYQRDFAYSGKGAVLDGRDIGTVVCPNADIKFYITASVDTRALRRYKELQEQDNSVIYDHVLQDLIERDTRDQGRTVAPLAKAEDAFAIDTTGLDADTVFETAVSIIQKNLQKEQQS